MPGQVPSERARLGSITTHCTIGFRVRSRSTPPPRRDLFFGGVTQPRVMPKRMQSVSSTPR